MWKSKEKVTCFVVALSLFVLSGYTFFIGLLNEGYILLEVGLFWFVFSIAYMTEIFYEFGRDSDREVVALFLVASAIGASTGYFTFGLFGIAHGTNLGLISIELLLAAYAYHSART